LVDFLESGINILSDADKKLFFSAFQQKKQQQSKQSSKQQQPIHQSIQSMRQK